MNEDHLYKLLPAIYRIRDSEHNWQLQALLRVIAEQVNAVEKDIDQLYQNWFIETCQDWVVPYIGDLVGYQPVHEVGEPGDITTQEGLARNKILVSRRDVGNTIHYRRRKGTLTLLEQLARDAANWPYAYAVESYKLLAVTQNINYRRSERGRSIDMRDNRTLYYLGSPFAQEGHTVDVRRPTSRYTTGRYNLPDVALYVWRLKVYPVVMMPAYNLDEDSDHHFTFSVLGNDMALYTNPASRHTIDGQPQPVDALNFPNPIGLRNFEQRLLDYYGDTAQGKSLCIWTEEAQEQYEDEPSPHDHETHHEAHEDHERHEHEHHEHRPGKPHGHHEEMHERHEQHSEHASQQTQHDTHGQHNQHSDHEQSQTVGRRQRGQSLSKQAQSSQGVQLVEPERIIAADLSEWSYHPRPGMVAVDPTRGRIAFPPGHVPRKVFVSYYYAFSADLGGGEYNRPLTQPASAQIFHVRKNATGNEPRVYTSLKAALAAWNEWKKQQRQSDDQPGSTRPRAVIEIADNGSYNEQLEISLEEYEYLHIRAANRTRPVLRLVAWDDDRPANLTIRGEYGSRITLDGLLITGRSIEFMDTIDTVLIRHCTLVPGRGIDNDCKPLHAGEPSLLISHIGRLVNIEHSITGSVIINQNDERKEPLRFNISDTILDATNEKSYVLSGPDGRIADTSLTIARSTMFGQIQVHAIASAENSIFQGVITVARRQQGCMRFCAFVPGPHTRTPRRYHCQPDLVEQAVDVRLQGHPREERDAAKERARSQVRPRFNSIRYGSPTYCQLTLTCATEIARGADDEAEMGVFHDLFQPQREANLRARLDDYTPAGMETGIIYVN